MVSGCRFHNAVESSGVNAEGLSDLPNRLAFFEQPLCKLSLLFVHLLRTSEANAAFVGIGATGACAFANQVSLELGDAGEDGHDHFSGMGGGVCPGFGEAWEAGTGLVDRFDDFEQTASGAGEAIEFPHNNDVAFAQMVEHAVQLRPLAVGSGELFAEDASTAGLLERVNLKSQALILSRNTRIAGFHPWLHNCFGKKSIGNVFCEILS